MDIMILFELAKGIFLVLLVALFGGLNREKVISVKSFLVILFITGMYYLSNMERINWFRNILPFTILGGLSMFGLLIDSR